MSEIGKYGSEIGFTLPSHSRCLRYGRNEGLHGLSLSLLQSNIYLQSIYVYSVPVSGTCQSPNQISFVAKCHYCSTVLENFYPVSVLHDRPSVSGRFCFSW